MRRRFYPKTCRQRESGIPPCGLRTGKYASGGAVSMRRQHAVFIFVQGIGNRIGKDDEEVLSIEIVSWPGRNKERCTPDRLKHGHRAAKVLSSERSSSMRALSFAATSLDRPSARKTFS